MAKQLQKIATTWFGKGNEPKLDIWKMERRFLITPSFS